MAGNQQGTITLNIQGRGIEEVERAIQRVISTYDQKSVNLKINANGGTAGTSGNAAQQARNSASTSNPVNRGSAAQTAARTPFSTTLPMSGGTATSAAIQGMGSHVPTLRMRAGSGVLMVSAADFSMPTGRYDPMAGDQTAMYTPDQRKWARTKPGADDGGSFLQNFKGVGPLSRLDTGTQMSLGFGAMSAAQTFSHYYAIGTQEQLTGRADHMGRARAAGEVLGGGVGLGLGFVFGGAMGASFGGSLGSTIGGAVFSRFGAQSERNALTTTALMGSAGLQAAWMGRKAESMYELVPVSPLIPPGARGGIRGGDTVRMPTAVEYAERQRGFVQKLRQTIGLGMGYDTESSSRVPDHLASEDEIAQTYAGVQGALVEGGWNPYGRGGKVPSSITTSSSDYALKGDARAAVQATLKSRMGYDAWHNKALHDLRAGKISGVNFQSGRLEGRDAEKALEEILGNNGRDIVGYQDQLRLRTLIRSSTPIDAEGDLSQFLTSNITRRYGHAAPEIEKSIAPILASAPEHGINAADIVSKFGATAASRYYEAFAEPDQKPKHSLQELQGVSTSTRTLDREMNLARYKVRGSGMAIAAASSRKMDVIASLPEGRESLAYAEANATRRAGQFAGYQEEDIDAFDLPRVRLQGRRDRANLLPFSPGNSFAVELESMSLDQKQMRQTQQRYRVLKGRGDLSAQEELGIVGQIESLQTNIAQSIGRISEGFADRLPAMMAGGNRHVARFNSYDAAAATLFQVGHPSRSFGAVNGRHLQSQDDFLQLFGSVGQDVGSVRSTTQGINNVSLDRVENLLSGILRALERNGGTTGTIGSRTIAEMRGAASADIARTDLGIDRARSTKR